MTVVERNKKPLRRRSLHHEVADQLREMIIENELTAGSRVDEKALSDLFGISKTPLREALKVLASEGFVDLNPNRSARITRLTAPGMEALFETIAALERFAAEFAVDRASDNEIASIRMIHDRMVRHHQEGRRADYFKLNHRIHCDVVALAQNEILADTHDGLIVRAKRARFMAITSSERWNEAVEEHTELIEALEARDGLRAGDVLFQHVLKTGETVRQFLEAQSDDPA